MNLLPRVEEAIHRYAMLSVGDGVVVACSGGPDSLALLRVLCELQQAYRLRLTAVYVDHGLRPECQKEGEFVRDLALAWGAQAVVRRVTTDLHVGAGSVQSRARAERYRLLTDVAVATNSRRIALGHTADDQVETLVMRFLKGTGCQGLAGIPPVNGRLIRPLLHCWRADTEAYCRVHELHPVHDPSNDEDAYLRNRIRHHLLPVLAAYNGHFKDALLHLADAARTENDWMESLVDQFMAEHVAPADNGWWCALSAFRALHPAMQRRVLRTMTRRVRLPQGLVAAQELTFRHNAAIMTLLQQGTTGASLPLPAGVVVWLERNGFWVGPHTDAVDFQFTLPIPGELPLPGSAGLVVAANIRAGGPPDMSELLQRSPSDEQPWQAGNRHAFIDYSAVKGPLVVRNRRPGDCYRLMGMQEAKKLQDILVDEGVPRRWRDRLPLFTDNLGIIWAPGARPAERAKVTPSTSVTLELKISNSDLSVANDYADE